MHRTRMKTRPGIMRIQPLKNPPNALAHAAGLGTSLPLAFGCDMSVQSTHGSRSSIYTGV
jgi:hypothetical protein